MLMFPTETDQPVLTIIFDTKQKTGSTFALMDKSGKIIFALSPSKSYQSIQLSGSSLSVGETYTLLYGCDISGDSLDGTYYTNAVCEGSSNTAEFILTNANMVIGSDGDETQYTNGIPGGPRR